MRVLLCGAFLTLAVCEAASATFVVNLETVDGQTEIASPLGGGLFHLNVFLTRSADEDRLISGAQFKLAADTPDMLSLATVTYNGLEWDADTVNGLALDWSPGPIPTTPSAALGSQYLGLWAGPGPSRTLMGQIAVTLAAIAPFQNVVLLPVSVKVFPDYQTQYQDILGTGEGVTFTPEPTMALAACFGLGALTLLRRRK